MHFSKSMASELVLSTAMFGLLLGAFGFGDAFSQNTLVLPNAPSSTSPVVTSNTYRWVRGDTLSGVLFRCGVGKKGSRTRLFGSTGWVIVNQKANPGILDWKKIRVGSVVKLQLPDDRNASCLDGSNPEVSESRNNLPVMPSSPTVVPPQPPPLTAPADTSRSALQPTVLVTPTTIWPGHGWRLWAGLGARITDDGIHTQTDGANFRYRVDVPSLAVDFAFDSGLSSWGVDLEYFRASMVNLTVTLPDDYKAGLYFARRLSEPARDSSALVKIGIFRESLRQISILAADSNFLVARTVDAFWLVGASDIEFDVDHHRSIGATIERTLMARLRPSDALISGDLAGWAASFQAKTQIWRQFDLTIRFRLLTLFGQSSFVAKDYINLICGYNL